MGSGRWDHDSYRAAAAYRAAHGMDDFAYSGSMGRRPRDQWRAAPELDPMGLTVRESRDSAEHPESTPIVIIFDVTGSMRRVPQIMQRELGKLHGLLQERRYVTDPQILFGAVGDADADQVPLQVGQFESDNRMDDQLRAIFLEGGGGGDKRESYDLAAWFVARHTATDAWEKRHKRGYLFLVGDELNKSLLLPRHVRRTFGYDPAQAVDPADLYAELEERWAVHYILPGESSYFHDEEIAEHWRALLGERFLRLEDPAAISEAIGLRIGLSEGVVGLDQGLDDLRGLGSRHGVTIARALAGTAPAATSAATPAGRRFKLGFA